MLNILFYVFFKAESCHCILIPFHFIKENKNTPALSLYARALWQFDLVLPYSVSGTLACPSRPRLTL